MGLLDSVIGAIGGAQGGQARGGDALQAVIAMLAERGGAGGAGLGGLLAQFQQGGLGDVVASWVGTGRNLPVSPEQLEGVLGDDMLSRFAQQLGVPRGEASQHLSQALPEAVDRLTPNGQLPSADAGLGDIGSLLDRFGRS